jgi:hypothetical protein
MNKMPLILFFGLLVLATETAAFSENESLACVKEIPNPMGLVMRKNYVLSCTTKVDDLTITKITADKGACVCRAYNSTDKMKVRARFMATCLDAGNPCDFTEVDFETSRGNIVFTWDPDTDETGLR